MIDVVRMDLYRLPGYNMDVVYDRVNEILGTEYELEIDQCYGTDCYDVIQFPNGGYLQNEEYYADAIKKGQSDYYMMFAYLWAIGELPKVDILCEISY